MEEVNSSIRIDILITYRSVFSKEFLKDFIIFSDNSKPRGLRLKSFQSCLSKNANRLVFPKLHFSQIKAHRASLQLT